MEDRGIPPAPPMSVNRLAYFRFSLGPFQALAVSLSELKQTRQLRLGLADKVEARGLELDAKTPSKLNDEVEARA
jgi:hypothetical protein